jgi:ribonuclease P protein component
VGRKVGNAVTRNRVRRRLREQVRSRLDRVPPGGLVVVRALPSAAGASSDDLGHALDQALAALTTRAPRGPRPENARGRAVEEWRAARPGPETP